MAEQEFCCPRCGGGPPYGPYPRGSNQVSGHTKDQCLSHFMAKGREQFATIQREKAERIYYQEIVYDVCNSLDALLPGSKIICGSPPSPRTGVQDGMAAVKAHIVELEAIVDSINSLRGDAGACVLIYCDNDDISSDIGCAVAVTAHWTEWQLHRFTGENLTDALTNACEAAEAAKGNSDG